MIVLNYRTGESVRVFPCPWCGHSRVDQVGAARGQLPGWCCECDSCHSKGPSEPTVDQAITAWNKVASTAFLASAAERLTSLLLWSVERQQFELSDYRVYMAARPLNVQDEAMIELFEKLKVTR